MPWTRRWISALACAVVLAGGAAGQGGYVNRNLVVIDPAHGGPDAGVSLNGHPEKEVTLAFAETLKGQLQARGFSVLLTREADVPAVLPSDQRAGTANHVRPVACLVIHATGAGSGVHLFTSALTAVGETGGASGLVVPWETAQAGYAGQSQRLANDVGVALLKAKVPLLMTRASMRPLDNMTCAAVAIEVADAQADAGAQGKVAEVVAGAMLGWRDVVEPRVVTRAPAALPSTTGDAVPGKTAGPAAAGAP